MKVVTGQSPVPASPRHIAVEGASSFEAITAMPEHTVVVALDGQICITASPVHIPRAGVHPELHPMVTICPAVQVRTPPAMVSPQLRGTPVHDGPASLGGSTPPSPPQRDEVHAQSGDPQAMSREPVEVP